jgi:alpha-1,3-rhamnosyl/mannosyltransferase
MLYETNFYYKQRKLTGIGRYTYNLVSAIGSIVGTENIVLFGRLLSLKNRYRDSKFYTRAKEQGYLGRTWPRNKNIDILHATRYVLPDWPSIKKVITIHDMTQVKASKGKRSAILDYYSHLVKNADHIISVSKATKRDIIDILNVHSAKISVTFLGVDEFYTRPEKLKIKDTLEKYNIERPYFFNVGNFDKIKNTDKLVKAFILSKVSKDYNLVRAGINLHNDAEKNNIKHLGYVPDTDMPALYSGASGFLFPAVHSGFGLPILEAMACGTPVLTSNTEAAPEVAGGHAILADPYSVEDISQGFDKLLNASAEDIEKAVSYARKFTWKKCAEETIKVYKKLMFY